MTAMTIKSITTQGKSFDVSKNQDRLFGIKEYRMMRVINYKYYIYKIISRIRRDAFLINIANKNKSNLKVIFRNKRIEKLVNKYIDNYYDQVRFLEGDK